MTAIKEPPKRLIPIASLVAPLPVTLAFPEEEVGVGLLVGLAVTPETVIEEKLDSMAARLVSRAPSPLVDVPISLLMIDSTSFTTLLANDCNPVGRATIAEDICSGFWVTKADNSVTKPSNITSSDPGTAVWRLRSAVGFAVRLDT